MTTYELLLDKARTEATRMRIMQSFRLAYGWEEHHLFDGVCCGKGHPCNDKTLLEGKEETEIPLMSAADYQYVLNKSEREKEEYKKRIFL